MIKTWRLYCVWWACATCVLWAGFADTLLGWLLVGEMLLCTGGILRSLLAWLVQLFMWILECLEENEALGVAQGTYARVSSWFAWLRRSSLLAAKLLLVFALLLSAPSTRPTGGPTQCFDFSADRDLLEDVETTIADVAHVSVYLKAPVQRYLADSRHLYTVRETLCIGAVMKVDRCPDCAGGSKFVQKAAESGVTVREITNDAKELRLRQERCLRAKARLTESEVALAKALNKALSDVEALGNVDETAGGGGDGAVQADDDGGELRTETFFLSLNGRELRNAKACIDHCLLNMQLLAASLGIRESVGDVCTVDGLEEMEGALW
ncbi:hypothetical protein MBLNU230_g4872t1 [Neophaeotheca triangularis]